MFTCMKLNVNRSYESGFCLFAKRNALRGKWPEITVLLTDFELTCN